MKKNFVLITLSVLLLSACKDKKEPDSPRPPDIGIDQYTKGGMSCKDCSSKETFGHTFAEFEDVVDRYRDERWKVINEAFAQGRIGNASEAIRNEKDKMADSRAIWFSLDSLKQFICTIEKYSAKLNVKPDSLGIRMYYAVYNDKKKRFPQRHTIFMVPTYKMKNSPAGTTGVDFDPRYNYFNDGKEKVTSTSSISILKGKPPVQMLTLTNDNNDPQMRANDGDLCPPCTKGCVHQVVDQ